MSESASKYLKAIIAVVLISIAFLHTTANLAAHAVIERPFLFHQKFPFQEKITPIEKNRIYSDFLLPNASEVYVIEVLEEKSLLIFYLMIDTENATLEVDLEGPVDRMRLSLAYDPMPYIYYVENRGEVNIIITNHQGDIVYYKFFVDISEPLGDTNSKSLLLNGSQVAFHVDLRRDDRVSLNLKSPNHLYPRIRVFALCYELMLEKSSYMLCFRRETLDKNLSFTADLGGRYYILVESVRGEGTVSLESIIISPPWNQDWLWLVFSIAFVTVTSLFFTNKIKKTRNLERAVLYTLIAYCWWFITIGLSTSLVGSFNYGAPIFVPLFYLSIISYGLSLGIQIYAAYLDRKKTIRVCPYCGRKVDLEKDNYCCGKIVKKISEAWFLMPLSVGFLFFILSYAILEWFLLPVRASLWMGSCGSIVGGIIGWWINKKIHRKSWEFLVAGVVFSFFSPLLIGFLLDMSFRPHIELEWPGKLIRIRIAPLTLPLGITIVFAILALGLSSVMAYHLRKMKWIAGQE